MGARESVGFATGVGDADRVAKAAAMPSKEFLSFRLGNEEYGIDILRVQEIRGYEAPTKLAGTPDFIKGVINLRGVIVPIVDLRMKLGMTEAKYDEFTVVIILNVADRVVGSVVDSVSDVIDLSDEQVKPAPEFNDRVDTSFITGLAPITQGEEQRTLILMDIEKLMSSPEMGLVNPGFTG
jgi:purine-binding chemotaxis protein CheW